MHGPRKTIFLCPFMDQMLVRLAGKGWHCFFMVIQVIIRFLFRFKRMSFGLCNAPAMFQRCMMSIFSDMVEDTIEVFMDDFSVVDDSFEHCLSHFLEVLKGYEDCNLVLNWEKYHFMVKECIELGHRISKKGIEVDRSKVKVIERLFPL